MLLFYDPPCICRVMDVSVGLNVFIQDNHQAFRLRVVLQQIYMRHIHNILHNVHIYCQHTYTAIIHIAYSQHNGS